jgi:hypothetical protein
LHGSHDDFAEDIVLVDLGPAGSGDEKGGGNHDEEGRK